jgi:hypothetical protein
MKTCPTCSRTYDDDTLSFCLDDGSPLLSGPPDAQVTQRIPAASLTDPYAQSRPYTGQQPGPHGYGGAEPPPTLQYNAGARAEPQRRSSRKLWLAIAGVGAVLLLAAGIGVGVILSRGDLLGGNDNRQQSLNTNNENRNNRSTNTTNAAPTPAPTPTPAPRVAEELGLVGSWSGTQNGNPASLAIVGGEGNTFSGTKVQGVNQVTFVGTIDAKTRRVTIRETKLLKGTPYSNGSGWSLATETGALSADGSKLSGTGTDEYNRKVPYKWSYRKK